MAFQIASSTASRQRATEHINYEQTSRPAEGGNNLRSAAVLRKEEQSGERLTISDEQMLKMVDHAIKALQGPHTSAQFSVHDATNTIMMKIVNTDTGELIREIPPEKTLDIVAKLLEVNGLLIDTKV